MQRARYGLLGALRGALRLCPDSKSPIIRCYLEHVLSQLGVHSPRLGLAFTRLIDPTATWIAGLDVDGGLVVLRHAPYDHGTDAALFDQRVVLPLNMMDCAATTIGPVFTPRSAALKQFDEALAGIVFIRGTALRHDCFTGVLIPETTILDICKRKRPMIGRSMRHDSKGPPKRRSVCIAEIAADFSGSTRKGRSLSPLISAMARKVGKLVNKASDYDIAFQECSQAVGDAGINAFISGFLQLEDIALRKRRLEHLDASGIAQHCEDTRRVLRLFVKKAWDTKHSALHAKINAIATDLVALYQLMDDDLRKPPCVKVMDADETRWLNQCFQFDHRARILVRGHHGFCLGYSRADASTFVHLVFVHPAHRRCGWATRVLQGLGDILAQKT